MQAVAGISGLRRQVSQRREVSVVHCPQDELYLHEANQISLSRIWNRQIPYHVELSNRSAPIGGKVPIAVRIGCSDILFIAVQIFLAQKIKFPGNPAKQTQIRKKLLLKSKCNDLSTGKFHDKLPSLNLDREPGTTMITGSVPLLDEPKTTLKLHPDVNYKKVKATHSMLFVIDITIPNLDPSTSQKTTICRLTAETPFRIRSPRTHTYDMSVPQYTETHNSAIYDNILPPPFSSSPSPLPLSPRSSHSSTDTDDPELSRRKFSSVSFSSSCTPVCSATDHVCPPPAYESIF
ncbi:hypothetical protein UA08_08776 [Talaromyces atroroseus]|uniref:Arrestin C-terminal-like domain-containing protein n=1 Tax=Talaromyces atroroseus TaxID=1441469 RepID=A0A225ADH4_TALAT|nr:hypothetical protein UA08_08776 [Talaromyces atroroseus]OKL55984.1 hypothetical protein UA08_08776 [Talaromyces atroroseus]